MDEQIQKNQIQKTGITPKDVLDIIYSVKTVEFNAGIEKKYQLTPKQIHQLAIIEGEIFEKKLPIDQFLIAIKTKLNIDTEKAKTMAYEVCENLFLPVAYYFPGLKIFMAQLKSPPSSQPTDSNVVNLKNR